jgi:hypothetical protein
MWVIYAFPVDYPDQYVARFWKEGLPTLDVITSADLEVVRQKMIDMGLGRIPRFEEDDSCILETWM